MASLTPLSTFCRRYASIIACVFGQGFRQSGHGLPRIFRLHL